MTFSQTQTNHIITVVKKRFQELASAAAALPPMSHPSPGIPEEGCQAAAGALGGGVGGPPASPHRLRVTSASGNNRRCCDSTEETRCAAGGGCYTRGSDHGPAARRPRRRALLHV